MACLDPVKGLRHGLGGFGPHVDDGGADRDRLRLGEQRFGDARSPGALPATHTVPYPMSSSLFTASGEGPLLVVLDEQIGTVGSERWCGHVNVDTAASVVIPVSHRARVVRRTRRCGLPQPEVRSAGSRAKAPQDGFQVALPQVAATTVGVGSLGVNDAAQSPHGSRDVIGGDVLAYRACPLGAPQ